MKHRLRVGVSVMLAGALSMLYSCGKEELAPTSPTAASSQQAASSKDGSTAEKAQKAWDKFVADVRQGLAKDPVGQYVSDDTWVESDGGPRPMRPTMDLSQRAALKSKAGDVGILKLACEDRPDDPDCTFTPTPIPTTAFSGSEGIAPYSGTGNFAGDILDLKIAKAPNFEPDAYPLDGYTRIPINLNYGAGGQTIYLTFTRDPSKVQLGDEAGRHR